MDSWKVIENQFHLDDYAKQESLFTIANGFIGMRGDGSEKISPSFSHPGTFINGFFEKDSIIYGESAYGFAKNKQIMLTVCNAKQISICIDDEVFHPEFSHMDSYYRELDMQLGIENRKVIWSTSSGKKIQIENKNFVSMTRKLIAGREISITPLNFSGNIRIKSYVIDEPVIKENSDDPRVEEGLNDGAFSVETCTHYKRNHKNIAFMKQTTKRSHLSVACAVLEEVSQTAETIHDIIETGLVTTYNIEAIENKPIYLRKYISYVTSQNHFQENYEEEAIAQVLSAHRDGWETLLQEQTDFFANFWSKADVTIKNNDSLTQAIRFNLFQLLQSTGRDTFTSTASKGLSGEGYGGHYFWESEAYIAPVFMYIDDTIARSLLIYRYQILDKAREQARLLGHTKGALYSWRSIDGEESSAYFLAGSAQYHINADIALAIARYLDESQDWEFLEQYGLEILLETARIWIDMGHYSELKDGKFCIDCVTGPDEYTALVNNNCYTNMMARENLWNAVKYAEQVKQQNPKQYQAIIQKIHLDEIELKEFQQAADNMYIPYSKELNIHMQDDTFLNKKKLDLSKIPHDHFPLLLHYHPLFIYRHQVCKQPDLLLAQFFLHEYFSSEEQKRNFDYYEQLATHDSSLSFCIFSIIAADIGNIEQSYDYFMKCIRTDLDDLQKNTKDGLHMANMAGAWMSIVHGFAGFKANHGMLSFRPMVPADIDGYQFSIQYRGHRLNIEVANNQVIYKLLTDTPMDILHKNEIIYLDPQQPQVLPL